MAEQSLQARLGSEDEETTASYVFQRLEREFQDVIKELEEDDHLEKFKSEYEKIFGTLQKSIQNEKRLYNKCVELNREILSNSSRVEGLLELTSKDQEVIKNLGIEIKNGWAMVESSASKFQNSMKTIESLQKTINDLKEEIERTKKQRLGRDKEIRSLLLKKENLKSKILDYIREKKGLLEDEAKFEREIFHLEQQQLELEDKLKRLDEIKSQNFRKIGLVDTTHLNLRQNLDKILKKEKDVSDGIRELRKKSSKERYYKVLKEEEIKEVKDQLAEANSKRDDLDTDSKIIKNKISEQEERFKKVKKDKENVLEVLRSEKSKRRETYNALEIEKKRLIRIEIEGRKIEQKQQTLLDFRDGWEGKIDKLAEESDKVTELRKREQKNIRHQIYETKKLKVEVVLARQKGQEKAKDQFKLIIINNQMEDKIQRLEQELVVQDKQLKKVEQSREKYAREASESQKKYKSSVEKVKIQKLQNDDIQKKIVESQERLKEQQNRYEQVRIDRNMYSRQLVESNEEIAFMKRKFDIMSQQLNQLSEEISTSIRGLQIVEAQKKKLLLEKKKKMVVLSKVMRSVKLSEEFKKKLDQEKERLNSIIDEMDKIRKQKRVKLQQVTYDRDLIGTQLIRRNDELALLTEKVKIHSSLLRNGNVKFLQLNSYIRMLKLRVKEYQREIILYRKNIKKLSGVKAEIMKVKNSLIDVKKKTKALSEILEDPTRKPRWRRLSGSDHSNFEMTIKIQNLQKRLILNTEESLQLSDDITRVRKINNQLEHILRRNENSLITGAGVKKNSNYYPRQNVMNFLNEECNKYQEKIRKLTNQMKTVSSEINMYKFLHKEEHYANEKYQRELNEISKQYFYLRKNNLMRKRISTASNSNTNSQSNYSNQNNYDYANTQQHQIHMNTYQPHNQNQNYVPNAHMNTYQPYQQNQNQNQNHVPNVHMNTYQGNRNERILEPDIGNQQPDQILID